MNLLRHEGKQPQVDSSAWVAPTATLVGDVTVGKRSKILFGAVIAAESGPVTVGEDCVIMENAVLRGVSRQPLVVGNNVLVGPHAHLSGCRVEDEVFIATGAAIFNGAVLEATSVVRVNGIVHVRSRLVAGTTLPINWIAIGDPAQLLPPHYDAEIQNGLNERDFSGTVFGLERGMVCELTRRYCRGLTSYRDLESITERDAQR